MTEQKPQINIDETEYDLKTLSDSGVGLWVGLLVQGNDSLSEVEYPGYQRRLYTDSSDLVFPENQGDDVTVHAVGIYTSRTGAKPGEPKPILLLKDIPGVEPTSDP